DRLAVELLVEAGLLKRRQGGNARGDRQRVAGECTRLIDGPQRRNELHDVDAAAVRADRHAPADDLAETRKVRHDAGGALEATETDAEAGDDLVEDQQRAVVVAERAYTL